MMIRSSKTKTSKARVKGAIEAVVAILTVRPAPSPRTLVLLPAGALVHRLHHRRLVEQDDPTLAVLSVTSVVEVTEVDVGHALVRLVHYTHADVAVFLVLAVQRVTDDVVRRFGVKRRHTEDLVAPAVHLTTTDASRGTERTPSGASPSVTHH